MIGDRWAKLDEFGSEARDLLVSTGADFAEDRTEDTGTSGVSVVIDDDAGVIIASDVSPVCTADLLARSYENAANNLLLGDVPVGKSFLDGSDEDLADAGVSLLRSSKDLDAEHRSGSGIVGDDDDGFCLDHLERRLSDGFDDFPALEAGERAGLADHDLLSFDTGSGLVVRIEFRGDFIPLVVLRVGLVGIDRDNNGLLHLRARDDTGLGSHVGGG